MAEYELGIIKKHENTRPDKVEDRTAHMLALEAQTGLIFLAFRNTEPIRLLIYEATLTKPIYDFEKVRVDMGAPDQLVQFGWTEWSSEDNKPSSLKLDLYLEMVIAFALSNFDKYSI